MKKSNFIAMVMGVIGGIPFALGMCMCLLPEWNAFKPGVIMGSVGLVILLIAVAVWRKLEGKAPIHLSGKTIGIALFGIVGALTLGAGMCFAMVWNQMILGIVIGIVGIVLLLSLVPLTKGIQKNKEVYHE